jgi:hypothetical protein
MTAATTSAAPILLWGLTPEQAEAVQSATGVLMSQSSATGGAMNAYRFALELKRP